MNNKLINIINGEQKITFAVFIVSISLILLRFITVLNSVVFAKVFGTSISFDIFLAVQSIIDIIVAFFTITLGVTFIPIYIDLLKERKTLEGYQLVNNLFTILSILSLFLALTIFYFAPYLIEVIYKFDHFNKVTAINLLRTIAFSIPPFVLSGHITNILVSKKQFIIPYSINILIALLPALIVYLFGNKIGIYSLAVASLVASYGNLFLLYAIYLSNNLNFKFTFNFNNIYLRRIVYISLPLFFSASAVQINTFVDRIFLKNIMDGAISAINYARTIREIPLMAVSAIPLTILPYLVDKKNSPQYAYFINKIMKIGIFILVPSFIIVFIISNNLINILYLRGKFDFISKDMTLACLYYLLPGGLFYWLITIITRVFYTEKRFNIVIYMGIFAVIFNIISDLIFSQLLSFKGIALSTSLMEIVFFVIYMYLIKIYLKDFKIICIFKYLLKIILISLLMFGILKIFINNTSFFSVPSLFYSITQLFIYIVLAVFIYILLSKIFKIDEYYEIKLKLLNLLRNK